jgi:hypothetical protein
VSSTRAGDEKLLRALREMADEEPLRLKVTGHCMSPLVNEGDFVEVSRERFYWPGDVIAFRTPDRRLLLHRVIGYWRHSHRLGLVTQGDSCSSCEASFGFDRVIGRITGGDGAASLVSIPFKHRLWTLGRFTRLIFNRILARAKSR